MDKFLKEWVQPALDEEELKVAVADGVKVELSV